MLGFKIFDSDSQEKLTLLLAFVEKENLCIEIALYNEAEKTIAFKNFLLNNETYQRLKNKSIHLDYKKYIGGYLDEASIFKFKAELTIAQDLNIHNAVLHYQTPATYMNHLNQLEDVNLEKNLTLIRKIAKDFNTVIHIENTYLFQRKDKCNDLINHRKIWDTVIRLGFQDTIGICLDWGHVKAFANDDLEVWMDYVKHLRNNNMSIYMHVHDNDGKKDLHETLHNGRERGFDKIEGNKPFIYMLNKYVNQFQKESLILEYNSDWAIEEYLKIKEELKL